MNWPFPTESRATALAALIVTALLVVSGVIVRGLVATSFASATEVRAARIAVLESLQGQLDEETGIRGYAATKDPYFLEPYTAAQKALPQTLARVQTIMQSFNDPALLGAASDASAASAAWQHDVARPLIASQGKDLSTIELHGKSLVDRFRADIKVMEDALSAREATLNHEAQAAIDRLSLFVGAAAALIVVGAIATSAFQARLETRVEEERSRAEEQERTSTRLRAAYEAEKRIADTLQDAFSQRPLPSLPTLRFSATYVPATEEARIGGDWYDALEMPNHRVLFAIGDVAGHGIDAAVIMNRTRQSLISAALYDADPASLLARVNGELLSQSAPLVTAVAGFADSKTYEFTYSTAGHPPPVLLEPGREPRMLEFGALPLGVKADSSYQTYRLQSVPGAMLVLYTDGAIEHSRNVLEGERLLLAAASKALTSGDPDPASVIHSAIFEGRSVGDDVAILTIGFASASSTGLTISADSANASFAGRLRGNVTALPNAERQGRLSIARLVNTCQQRAS